MGVQDYLYSNFDSDIVEEFLMLLDSIEDNIDLVIERLYERSEYKDAINDLFRMFHNLKSATSFLKLKRLNIFAQFVEEVLEEARKYDYLHDESLIDWLFSISNQFHIWYKEIDSNIELSKLNTDIFKVPSFIKAK